jgi:hypothetical protein
MNSRNRLGYFVCIPAAILLFTILIIIINNIFLSSHNSNALMYNGTNQASFDKHMPFKHQFIQSIYADSNIGKQHMIPVRTKMEQMLLLLSSLFLG